MPPGTGGASYGESVLMLSSGCQPPTLEGPGTYDFKFIHLFPHFVRKWCKRRGHPDYTDGSIIQDGAAGRLQDRHLFNGAVFLE
mmetsp:Transcript_9542/g.14524  ORF Transcript_9542/g.14524 Transcript_9542/m.14524 type:complete len:84 (+) Transcript_9542:414-665(+)